MIIITTFDDYNPLNTSVFINTLQVQTTCSIPIRDANCLRA